MMIVHEAGVDQGGFGAAEGPSQQLTVLRKAAGVGMWILQDAGRDQGRWSVADAFTYLLYARDGVFFLKKKLCRGGLVAGFLARGSRWSLHGVLLLDCRGHFVAPPLQDGWGPGPRARSWDSVVA